MAFCKECNKRASFNYKGKPAKYCKVHALKDMINVNNKICLECDKRALYNIKGKPAEYCCDHKKQNMINVVSKRCLECNKRPSYNYEGMKKSIYCKEHKKDGMIIVRSKKCLECNKQPMFNKPGEKRGLYCGEHKKQDMIDVVNKKCIKCSKQPTYNYKNETSALYCKEHSLKNMIDIVNKKCLNCNIRANYNYEKTTEGIYCYEHKKDGMININSKKCLDCDKQPIFNYEGEKGGIYCSEHKKYDMVDIISKKCKSEFCSTRAKDKYDGYCTFCYVNLFPDKPVSRNYKTKEHTVAEHILNMYPDFTWTTDKRIDNGCSNRRPDLLLDLGYQVIIIEVDENQHKYYDTSCENKRLMELSQDINHRPLVFIRFNPDSYNSCDKKIKSCWKISKQTGLCVIQDKKMWNNRLNTLNDTIDFWTKNTTNKTVNVVELFYDN